MNLFKRVFQFINLQCKLFLLFDKRGRLSVIFGVFLGGLAASAELLSLIAIPFIIRQSSQGIFVTPLIIKLALLSLLASIVLRLFDLKWRYKTTSYLQRKLSIKLLKAYMFKNVIDSQREEESSYQSALIYDLEKIGSVFTYQLYFFTNLQLSCLILVGMLWFSLHTTIVVLSISLTYYIIALAFSAKRVHLQGKISFDSQKILVQQLRTIYGLSQALFPRLNNFNSFFKTEKIYSNWFNSQAYGNIIVSIPKIVIDHLVLLALLLFTLWALVTPQSPADLTYVFSLLSLYLISLNRLLPCFQQIYLSASIIGQNYSTIKRIVASNLVSPPSFNLTYSSPGLQISTLSQLNITSMQPDGLAPFLSSQDHLSKAKGLTTKLISGRIYSLNGRSGIGKSTIMKMLAGFIPSVFGRMSIDGTDSNIFLDPAWMRICTYVDQKLFTYPGSVVENITLASYLNTSVDFKLLRECTLISGLSDEEVNSDLIDFNTGLSGGQLQRVAIARALYTKPKILLLDESFTGIDLIARKKIFHRLNQYVIKNKIIVILVSHDYQPKEVSSSINLYDCL